MFGTSDKKNPSLKSFSLRSDKNRLLSNCLGRNEANVSKPKFLEEKKIIGDEFNFLRSQENPL